MSFWNGHLQQKHATQTCLGWSSLYKYSNLILDKINFMISFNSNYTLVRIYPNKAKTHKQVRLTSKAFIVKIYDELMRRDRHLIRLTSSPPVQFRSYQITLQNTPLNVITQALNLHGSKRKLSLFFISQVTMHYNNLLTYEMTLDRHQCLQQSISYQEYTSFGKVNRKQVIRWPKSLLPQVRTLFHHLMMIWGSVSCQDTMKTMLYCTRKTLIRSSICNLLKFEFIVIIFLKNLFIKPTPSQYSWI